MKTKLAAVFIAALSLLTALSCEALAAEPPSVTAGYALVCNTESGKNLYSKNADQKIYPASMVKIMTAILAIENIKSLDELITVPAAALKGGGTSSGLKEGEQLAARDLLYLAILRSGSDACRTLALFSAGTEEDFVALMNKKAADLEMSDTNYTNSYGLDDYNQQTTVNDLYKLIKYASSNADFMEICGTQFKYIAETNLSEKRNILTSNLMIVSGQGKVPAYYYRYASGVISTYSEKAGYCVATIGRKNNMTNICIVMDSTKEENTNNSYIDAKALLDYSFDNFKYVKLNKAGDPLAEVQVRLSASNDHMILSAAADIAAVIPSDLDPKVLQKDLKIKNSYDAPIDKGKVLGKIEYSYNGQQYAAGDLAAASSVKSNLILLVFDKAFKFFTGKYFIIGLVLIILIIALYSALVMNSNKKKGRRNNKRRRYFR